MMSFIFNEKNYYSEQNTSDNEDFPSIFQLFLFEPEQKKRCGNKSHEEETKHINSLNTVLLLIRIKNFNCSKCRYCKNSAREVDWLCCRKEVTMLIASAKIPEHERSISPSSFYEQLPNY